MYEQSATRAHRPSVPVSSSGSRDHLRIVALGGGTGLPAVLRAARIVLGPCAPPEALTAVVAVTDDGGSSGKLRRAFGVLPPGDVRNCVAALAGDDTPLALLLQHQFPDASALGEHPVGNLVLAALTEEMQGDLAAAVGLLGRAMGIRGRVLPVTHSNVHLKAEYVNGETQVGESAIVARRLPIKRLTLEQPARPLPEVIEALVNADVIIVGPGSLYTSLLPVLQVDGVAPTIYGLCATRIYVANLMTEPGETDGMSLEDHLDVIRHHVGVQLFDHVLVNSRPLAPVALHRYAGEGSHPVLRRCHVDDYGGARIVSRDLAWELRQGKIRHDPAHLAAAISQIAQLPCEQPWRHTA